jgi:hypothetical protein
LSRVQFQLDWTQHDSLGIEPCPQNRVLINDGRDAENARRFSVLLLRYARICEAWRDRATASERFGKSYTVESVRLGKEYKFRSENVSVDAIVANGVSISETYLSDHSLTASGEPPNEIARAVLRTNVTKARWNEIEAALYSSNDNVI